MSEFEDREKELLDQPTPASDLGDLPADLQLARGEESSDNEPPEFIPPGQTITQGRTRQGVPMDIAREARISERPGEIGTVILPYGVTSTYDGRHINARDFLITEKVSFNVNNEATSATTIASITVPGGYTGVWRQFSVQPSILGMYPQDALINGLNLDGILYTLLVNGVVVPEYEDMALGQAVNMFALDTWVLALQEQTFQVKITYNQIALELYDAAVGFQNDYFFLVGFYGQNLLTRGLPLPFEISSQEYSGSSRT